MPGETTEVVAVLPSGELSREQILATDGLERERVEVPGLGGYVFVREMSARERDRFDVEVFQDRAPTEVNMRAALVAACCVSSSGERLFSAEDVVQLGERSHRVLEPIVEAALRLNPFGDAAEGAVGNSSGTAGGGRS